MLDLENKDSTIFRTKKTINVGQTIIDLHQNKLIMGILNVTPDSFFDGGNYVEENNIDLQIKKLIDEGADIIDIGGYSSRPGADHIEESIEVSRVVPAIKKVRSLSKNVIISIDTFRSSVAEKAINAGANIINDISAGVIDPKIMDIASNYNVPYIMMHMRGTPQNMQSNTDYSNLVLEIIRYFSERIQLAKSKGVKDIIIDPGFGFSKTLNQNYDLLKNLPYIIDICGHPLLVGVSRKSMVYKLFNSSPDEALNGTTVVNTMALLNGANILRVHDVKEAKEALIITEKVNG